MTSANNKATHTIATPIAKLKDRMRSRERAVLELASARTLANAGARR